MIFRNETHIEVGDESLGVPNLITVRASLHHGLLSAGPPSIDQLKAKTLRS